jgi:O-antigen biosynthesis protein
MGPVPDISICIASYQRHDAPNVATIAASLPAAAPGRTTELVVALNGIGADDARVPADGRTVDLGENRGVAPGWNAAARAATGDVLVFANDDAELGPGSLSMLADALAARPDVGAVSPVGTRWDIPGSAHRSFASTEGLAPGTLVECEVVAGYLFACRRDAYLEVGGFDEFYAPASWEEIDFCTALRAAGLRNYAVAGVEVAHEWGVSRRQMPWARIRWAGGSETWRSIHRRNREHFRAKWSTAALAPVEG